MRPSIKQIFETSLNVFELDKESYNKIKNTHKERAVTIRQVTCWLSQYYGYTQSEIGRYFGLSHSTVWWHKKKASDFMSYDIEYRSKIERALSLLKPLEVLNISTSYKFDGWITREKEEHGRFLCFTVGDKPQRGDIWTLTDNGYMYTVPKEAFPEISFDTEPLECEIILRLK